MEESTENLSKCFDNKYQIKYDRLLNRQFDNAKILTFYGQGFRFTDTRLGLSECLKTFLESPVLLSINITWEAYCDRITKEHKTKAINKTKDILRYYYHKIY